MSHSVKKIDIHIQIKEIVARLYNPEILSEICRDVGQIFSASFVIDIIRNGNPNWHIVLIGSILSLLSWTGSLLIIKNNH